MSTTAPIGDLCQKCYSTPCRCFGYLPPEPVATRLDPYFVYERIAAALERIAAAMESNQETEPA